MKLCWSVWVRVSMMHWEILRRGQQSEQIGQALDFVEGREAATRQRALFASWRGQAALSAAEDRSGKLGLMEQQRQVAAELRRARARAAAVETLCLRRLTAVLRGALGVWRALAAGIVEMHLRRKARV